MSHKRKLHGNSSGNNGVEGLENNPIAKVFCSVRKKNYRREISSTSSIKQVKMT